MKRLARTLFLWLGAVLMGLVVGATPAGAVGNTHISGVSTIAAPATCTELPSYVTLAMTGDLVGCWYTTRLEVVQTTPSGVYQERGEETFVGCLADRVTCGTFSTTYKFSSKYTVDGAEIFGRCEHPITGGTGGFAGIQGRVDFKDNVETGEFYYRGHFALR